MMDLSADSISAFADHLAINGASENTIRAYRSDLTGLALCADTTKRLEAEAASYLTKNRRVWSPKTTGRKLTAFRSFAKFNGEPTFLASYRAPTPGRPIPHPLPEGIDGVTAMVNAARTPTDHALLAFTGLLGLRVGEALSITANMVNERERTVTVRGKGDRTRTVPISERAWDCLWPAWLQARPDNLLVDLPDRTARRHITRLAEKAGLSRHVSSHDMRATLATAAYNATHDLRTVQELLGHANASTTESYTGISGDMMRAALEAVS